MKTVSILGCGWLGKPLAMALLKEGYVVRGSTTTESTYTNLKTLGIEPFLIHLNPLPTGPAHHPFFSSEILIVSLPPKKKTGGLEMYEKQIATVAAEAAKGAIEKILMISSTAVYPDLNRVVTEEDATEDSPLVRAENILRNHARFKTTIVRFSGLMGPDRHPGKFLAGKKNVAGATNPVNLIHQQDCIAIIQAILQQEAWGEVFNACAEHHPTREAFYHHAAQTLNLTPPEFAPTQESHYKIVGVDKLKQRLNYHFRYNDLFEALR